MLKQFWRLQDTTSRVAWNSYGVACFCCCRKNCDATRGGTRPCNLLAHDIALVTIRWTKLTLNEQFTKESEENGELPFLDCLVNRNNNELRTTVFRKPTPTYRLLDESSYNPTSHKATTSKTLTRRGSTSL